MTQEQLLTLPNICPDSAKCRDEPCRAHFDVIVLILTKGLVDFFSVMIDRDPEMTNYSERRKKWSSQYLCTDVATMLLSQHL